MKKIWKSIEDPQDFSLDQLPPHLGVWNLLLSHEAKCSLPDLCSPEQTCR